MKTIKIIKQLFNKQETNISPYARHLIERNVCEEISERPILSTAVFERKLWEKDE